MLPQFLVAVPQHEILARVLRNLRNIFIQQKRYQRALSVAENICLLLPDNAEELKQRGSLFAQLECFRPALADFSRYLELAPAAVDAETIRTLSRELETQVSRIS